MLLSKKIELSWQNLTTLPNVLTYLRMATIPVIMALLIPPSSELCLNLAFAVFVLASLTDYLDGILARRRNTVTSIGKLLDPLADKLLTSAVLIMLIPHAKVEAYLVWLILGREIIITGLRLIALGQGLIINASRMGKNKMLTQTLAFYCLLPSIPQYRSALDMTGTLFLWISVVFGYISALDYFVNFYKEAKKREQPSH